MKFSIGKYKVMHLGRNKSCSKDNLGTKLESSFAENLGSSVQERHGHSGARPGRTQR